MGCLGVSVSAASVTSAAAGEGLASSKAVAGDGVAAGSDSGAGEDSAARCGVALALVLDLDPAAARLIRVLDFVAGCVAGAGSCPDETGLSWLCARTAAAVNSEKETRARKILFI